MTSTLGSFPPPTRSGSVRSVYFPDSALDQLSSEGVALPSTVIAPLDLALTIATSRARSRADHDALVAALEREPGIIPFALAQRGVEDGDSIAESGSKAIDGLRGERDLRDKHDRRLASLIDDATQQLDVDKGLATAGDSVQQKD